MDESHLGVDAFSSVTFMENALKECGYDLDNLAKIARLLKEECLRLAANVCMNDYLNSENPNVLSRLVISVKRVGKKNEK